MLKARIKNLEDSNKPSVESIIQKIHTHAIKDIIDFDKYEALSLAQALTYCAKDTNHKSAGFYTAALQELRSRLDRPVKEFKTFFLALFADKDYTKVLDSVAKVEKSLHRPPKTRPELRVQNQSRCYRCGRPGHYANRCRQRPYPTTNPRAQQPPKPLL